MEIWKDLKGMEEFFLVSNQGRVKSKPRYINNNGTMVLKEERILSPFKTGNGYIQVNLTVNRKTIKKYIHVLVLEAFSDKPSDEYEVNHIDHDKTNNNLSNLEWVDRKQNQQKMSLFYDLGKSVKCPCGNDFHTSHGRNKKYCSAKCSRKFRDYSRLPVENTSKPSKEILLDLIKKYPFVKIGRMYKVSDNAVRKWCQSYDLPYKKKDIDKLKKL